MAYALQTTLSKESKEYECVLASSKEGVKRFKSFNVHSDNLLTIHDTKIRVGELSEFSKPAHYVEVGNCKVASVTDVQTLVESTQSKMLFIGHSWDNIQDCTHNRKILYPAEYGTRQAQLLFLGLGDSRIGVPLYNVSTFADLDHATYVEVTKRDYGFMYGDNKASRQDTFPYCFADYMKMTRLAYRCANYVVVGTEVTFERVFLGAMQYANLNVDKAVIHFYDFTSKGKKQVFQMNPADKSCGQFDYDGEMSQDNPAEIINIVMLGNIPRAEMHALIKNAIPLIATAGVASATEANVFGKIVLFQCDKSTASFSESYKDAIQKMNQSSESAAKVKKLLDQVHWQKQFSEDEHKAMVASLQTDAVTKRLIASNKLVFAKYNGKRAVETICKALQIELQAEVKEETRSERSTKKPTDQSSEPQQKRGQLKAPGPLGALSTPQPSGAQAAPPSTVSRPAKLKRTVGSGT